MLRAAFVLAVLLCLVTQRAVGVDPKELAALEDFYKSTNGKQWTYSDNWLKGDPCTNNWYRFLVSFWKNLSLPERRQTFTFFIKRSDSSFKVWNQVREWTRGRTRPHRESTDWISSCFNGQPQLRHSGELGRIQQDWRSSARVHRPDDSGVRLDDGRRSSGRPNSNRYSSASVLHLNKTSFSGFCNMQGLAILHLGGTFLSSPIPDCLSFMANRNCGLEDIPFKCPIPQWAIDGCDATCVNDTSVVGKNKRSSVYNWDCCSQTMFLFPWNQSLNDWVCLAKTIIKIDRPKITNYPHICWLYMSAADFYLHVWTELVHLFFKEGRDDFRGVLLYPEQLESLAVTRHRENSSDRDGRTESKIQPLQVLATRDDLFDSRVSDSVAVGKVQTLEVLAVLREVSHGRVWKVLVPRYDDVLQLWTAGCKPLHADVCELSTSTKRDRAEKEGFLLGESPQSLVCQLTAEAQRYRSQIGAEREHRLNGRVCDSNAFVQLHWDEFQVQLAPCNCSQSRVVQSLHSRQVQHPQALANLRKLDHEFVGYSAKGQIQYVHHWALLNAVFYAIWSQSWTSSQVDRSQRSSSQTVQSFVTDAVNGNS